MPKITIWLTSYNHEKFISKTIESILNQTFQDFELIIIDDCSTDHSWEIIKKYANQDKRIRPIRHETNMGGSQLDDSLDLINGEYIAIAHSDDVWDLTKLEKQFNFLDNNKNYIACFTNVKLIDENDNVFNDKNHPYYNTFQYENRNRFKWLRYFYDNGNCLCHPSVLIQKSAYKSDKLLPLGYSSFPDFYRWIKICLEKDIYILQEELTYFRIRNDSSLQDSGESVEKLKQIYLEQFFIIKQFFNLSDKNDILNVFPESAKYFIKDEFVSEFVIAKTFLDSPRESYHLAGLEKLFQLMSNKESKRKLKQYHEYTLESFKKDKQKYDIFNYISDDRYAMATLYIDYGEGYSQVNSITKKEFIGSNRIVVVKYDLQNIKEFDDIKQLRFDPDETRYRRVKILSIKDQNGNPLIIEPINSVKLNDMDMFYTIDPQYIIHGKGNSLEIMYEIDTIPNIEVEKYYQNAISRERKRYFDQKQKPLKIIIKEKIMNKLNKKQ